MEQGQSRPRPRGPHRGLRPARSDIEGGQITGREGFKGLVTLYRSGLPDLDVPIDEMFEVGDRVVIRWHATGTNTGGALGHDPTGKRLNMAGQHIQRFAGEQIAEEWVSYDTLGLILQLGLQPPA